ncbi:hypothetical protein PFLUV_G00139860 [Perca fluviatilis]|uniref:Integrase catalytic domain-containing protein n=1 Tax=Perca fluviatilis TaxID=8168 RepID=A0A6A5F0I3_PERFL|nr:hypothetical protein PFLUV_G00139860 [Perca fluviatilis]
MKRAYTIKDKTQCNPIEVSEPFELVGMDPVGKLAVTPRGHTYICVMIGYMTKWVEVYPIQAKKAELVAEFIIDFFYCHGAPKGILTDGGKEFVNKINFSLCEQLDIKLSLCSPYHPQTNGLVEKVSGTIQGALRKMVKDHPNNWDLYIKPTVFGLRTKMQRTTKRSPFYLLYGREARYPPEIPDKWHISHDKVEAVAAEEKPCPHISAVQREVYPESSAKTSEKSSGREGRWRGSIEDKSVDLLAANGEAIKRIDLDHLKKFVEPQPRIPCKWVSSPQPEPIPPPPSASPQSLPSAGPQSLSVSPQLDPIPPPTSPLSLSSASPQPDPIPMTPPPSAVPQFLSTLSVSPEELKVLYPKETRALHLDPLVETPDSIKKCQDVKRSFMRHRQLPISRWACSAVDHPRQPDATSCGAFVCKFAQLLLRGEVLNVATDQAAITHLRREIACTLVTESVSNKGSGTGRVSVRAMCHRSLKKKIVLKDSSPVQLYETVCSCAADKALSNHTVALLFQTATYSHLHLLAVPPVLSCTETAQRWHKPRTMEHSLHGDAGGGCA